MSDTETKEEQLLVPIAKPLAGPKLTKTLSSLIKEAAKEKVLRRGVKEVVKVIRKDKGKSKFICILAGDVTPLDVISHIPVLCEEHSIPYIYVPTRSELGQSAGTKRPTSVVMVELSKESDDDNEVHKLFAKCAGKIQEMQPKYD